MGVKITHFAKNKARERFRKWAEALIESEDLTEEQTALIEKCLEDGHVPNNLLKGLIVNYGVKK